MAIALSAPPRDTGAAAGRDAALEAEVVQVGAEATATARRDGSRVPPSAASRGQIAGGGLPSAESSITVPTRVAERSAAAAAAPARLLAERPSRVG